MKRLTLLAIFALLLGLWILPQQPGQLKAAVSQNLAVTVQTPNANKCTFVQGTDTAGTFKACYTGGTNGSKVVGIFLTSLDTASHVVPIQISSGTAACGALTGTSTVCFGGPALTITGAANYAGVPINVMSAANWPGLPVDSDGNPYIYLPTNTWTIQATFVTALTASTQVNVNVVGADF